MKKIAVFILAIHACFVHAQNRHEVSVGSGVNASMFSFSSSSGKNKLQPGGFGGVNYFFYFSPEWGIGTGAEYVSYYTSTKFSNVEASSNEVSDQGRNFVFTYLYPVYEENISVQMLNIPVLFSYRGESRNAFYMHFGGKIGVPLSADLTSEGKLETRGYFANTNVTYDDLPSYGFGSYDVSSSSSIDLGLAYMLSLELGVKWELNDEWNLYTGAYIDYGLNNMKEDAAVSMPMVAYQTNNPSEFIYGNMYSNSSSMKLMTAGITLRLSLGFGSFQKTQMNRDLN